MRRILIIILPIIFCFQSFSQPKKTNVYLIPGQGSDYRLYDNFDLGEKYNLINIYHGLPKEGMSMAEYASELFLQIDTNQDYILIGVSLGGMLSVEINKTHSPLKTIIISSAKCRDELPIRYKFQKYLPIYKLVSGNLSKKGALFLQPLVEPDRNNNKEVFVSMLEDKDPDFLKRTIAMILEWHHDDYPNDIIHIHGSSDRTIPIKNVDYDYLIEDGSHMMALTRGQELSELIIEILEN